MIFNTANAVMQGVWIYYLAPAGMYSNAWLLSPWFIIGVIIFLTGFIINVHSDHIVRNLRKPGNTAFHVPYGGMFKYVTSANYFGEFTEWVGWALLTFSWAGLVFAIWTFANLAPRANALRKWYIEKFGKEFPKIETDDSVYLLNLFFCDLFIKFGKTISSHLSKIKILL